MLFKKYISVDIGSKKTKIVCGRVKNNTVEIIEYAIIDTPWDSIIDGKIVDFYALNEVLKATLKENKIKGRYLLFIITGTAIISRDVQLPDSTDEELGKILKYEAQQYFPVDLNSYVVDYRPLEKVTTGEGVFIKVQLIAVPQKQVDEYVKFASFLKKEIVSIDIGANSLNRFLFPQSFLENKFQKTENASEDQGSGVAVLDVGYETIGVSIFNQGVLKFQRNLLNGFKDISSTLKNQMAGKANINPSPPNNSQADFSQVELRFGETLGEVQQKDQNLIGALSNSDITDTEHTNIITDEEATVKTSSFTFDELATTHVPFRSAEYSIETKDVDLDNPDVQNVLSPVLDIILMDLQRFFDFYNTRSNGNRISKIYLYGGGCRINGLKEYIERHFNLETDYLSTENSINFSNVVYKGTKPDFEDCFPLLVNAIGSLIR